MGQAHNIGGCWYDAVNAMLAREFKGFRIYPVRVQWSLLEPGCLILCPYCGNVGLPLRIAELNAMTAECAYAVINNGIRHVLIGVLEEQWSMPAVEAKV